MAEPPVPDRPVEGAEPSSTGADQGQPHLHPVELGVPVEVLADAGAVAERGAAVLADAIRDAVAERGRCLLAASGGRTPWAMYAALARSALPWERVHVAQVDERVAPAGHPDRNLEGLRAALGAVAGRVTWHPMPVEGVDLEDAADAGRAADALLDAAAAAYARELAEVAGVAPLVLDVVHLGLGADGHTASLVPGDPVVEAASDVAVTGLYAGRRRMTLTRAALDRARVLVWVVAGEDKREAVARLLARDPAIPAGRIAQQRARLIVDRAASGA